MVSSTKTMSIKIIFISLVLLCTTPGCSWLFDTEYTSDFKMKAFEEIKSGDNVVDVIDMLGYPFFYVINNYERELYYSDLDLVFLIDRKENILGVMGNNSLIENEQYLGEKIADIQLLENTKPTAIEDVKFQCAMLYSKSPGSNSPIKGYCKRFEIIFDIKTGVVIETKSYWYFD